MSERIDDLNTKDDDTIDIQAKDASGIIDSIETTLSSFTRDYWITSQSDILVLENPTPLQFMQHAVMAYKPLILRGLMSSWNAQKNWELRYLEEKIGKESTVNVNVTPDGLADAIKENLLSINDEEESNGLCGDSSHHEGNQNNLVFTYPCATNMNMSTFVDMMLSPEDGDAVPYLSEQNDNLRLNYPSLMEDIPSSIELANTVFDNPLIEAVNLWIGDERSVSSVHKDHFENFYCVVRGEKTFTLLPPTDTLFLPEIETSTAIYEYSKQCSGEAEQQTSGIASRIKANDLRMKMICDPPSEASEAVAVEGGILANALPAKISWIPVDPDDPLAPLDYPIFKKASPIRCRIKEGEILYIPAMWYHRVSQTRLTIAVNYWMEQKFDFRYVIYQTIRSLRHPTISFETESTVNYDTPPDSDEDC